VSVIGVASSFHVTDPDAFDPLMLPAKLTAYTDSAPLDEPVMVKARTPSLVPLTGRFAHSTDPSPSRRRLDP